MAQNIRYEAVRYLAAVALLGGDLDAMFAYEIATFKRRGTAFENLRYKPYMRDADSVRCVRLVDEYLSEHVHRLWYTVLWSDEGFLFLKNTLMHREFNAEEFNRISEIDEAKLMILFNNYEAVHSLKTTSGTN